MFTERATNNIRRISTAMSLIEGPESLLRGLCLVDHARLPSNRLPREFEALPHGTQLLEDILPIARRVAHALA